MSSHDDRALPCRHFEDLGSRQEIIITLVFIHASLGHLAAWLFCCCFIKKIVASSEVSCPISILCVGS